MLKIENVSRIFVSKSRGLFAKGIARTALDGVTLHVSRGESFGLVGESGSGKTTLTRLIMALDKPDSGRVMFDGTDVSGLSGAELRRFRSRVQIVFQDPYASLNPRMRVHDIISEPMHIHRATLGLSSRQQLDRTVELLEMVGMNVQHLYRYPHEFSGGQRQRIGIARALAVNPELLILDEPTSALDVSVQAQVLNLLHELQQRLSLTYFFISHDLGVIRYICDRVALVHNGRIVEQGDTGAVFDAPESDYARMLIAAMPDIDAPGLVTFAGTNGAG